MLTVDQKWDAIQALSRAEIKCRKLGDYYISAGTYVGGDGCLLGTYGNGTTPEAAVEDHFNIYTTLNKQKSYIVVDGIASDSTKQRKYHWSGWGWKELPEWQVEDIRSANGLKNSS